MSLAYPSTTRPSMARRYERALARAFVMSATMGGFLGGGCLIDERPFDQHLADCTDYCRLVGSRCTGNQAVYEEDPARPRGACMASCALMAPGDELNGDRGNTLRCRLETLRRADFEAPSLCAGMGPGGNGICGTDCEAYCDLRPAVCGQVQPDEPENSSRETCLRACQGLADESTFNPDEDLDEDTLQCRMIHLAEAAISPSLAEEHCWHSQLVLRSFDSPCAENKPLDVEEGCQRYCRLAMTGCQGEYRVYDDVEQCERACLLLDPGDKDDILENTMACRRYHAYSALTSPEEHCTHAGPTGDGHCGIDEEQGTGNCVSFCRIVEQACPSGFGERYLGATATDGSGAAACIEACASLEDSAMDGFRDLEPRYVVEPAPVGPTLKCRTLHAVRALATPDDLDECAAAFGAAGSPCG